jgi:hypothetical protein
MAVSDRLHTRLNKIPGVTTTDIALWIDDATQESATDETENENAIFYLALTIAYETIAANTAHYFKYSDGDESVDKSNLFDNYTKLAHQARKQYRKYRRGNGASHSHVGRADK